MHLSISIRFLYVQEKETGEISSLENLSAFLTLSHAENNYGFQPEKYGLTVKEATNIAVVFSRYDENEDGVLQISEIGKLAYSNFTCSSS